jgi:hypothetical protein
MSFAGMEDCAFMAHLTTTIGSYPKPDYLRIPVFRPKSPDPTRRWHAHSGSPSEVAYTIQLPPARSP